MSIFVGMATYCDPWLWKTVENCYVQAKYPERLTFGIFDQNHQDSFDYSETLPYKNQIFYHYIPVRDACGLCWARDRVFSMYREQKYILQIDSHCCFDRHWDQTLIDFYDEIISHHQKPILTGYPMRCVPENGLMVPATKSITSYMYVTRPLKNSVLKPESTSIGFNAMPLSLNKLQFYPAIHISGGFVFTSGKLVLDIPYDPRLGHVDELNMAIRAYTHGWDMVHPPYVPLYHYYNENSSNWDSEMCWKAEVEQARRQKVHVQNRNGELRMCRMLYNGEDFGIYGLGKSRTLEDFARFSGIDYPKRKIYWRYPDKNEAIISEDPEDPNKEWKNKFVGPAHDIEYGSSSNIRIESGTNMQIQPVATGVRIQGNINLVNS